MRLVLFDADLPTSSNPAASRPDAYRFVCIDGERSAWASIGAVRLAAARRVVAGGGGFAEPMRLGEASALPVSADVRAACGDRHAAAHLT